MTISSEVDERTLREISLVPFEAALLEAGSWSVMAAYNRLHGTYCSEHPLLADLVKSEWGFDGVVMSDWYGTHSTVPAANAGLDLEMPGPAQWFGSHLATRCVQARWTRPFSTTRCAACSCCSNGPAGSTPPRSLRSSRSTTRKTGWSRAARPRRELRAAAQPRRRASDRGRRVERPAPVARGDRPQQGGRDDSRRRQRGLGLYGGGPARRVGDRFGETFRVEHERVLELQADADPRRSGARRPLELAYHTGASERASRC